MHYEKAVSSSIAAITKGIAQCRDCPVGTHLDRGLRLAGQQAVSHLLEDLIALMFPGCHGHEEMLAGRLEHILKEKLLDSAGALKDRIMHALAHESAVGGTAGTVGEHADRADEITARMVSSLPGIQAALQEDISAGYEGDPAARSAMEVVLSYPSFKAVAAHRIAHVLYESGVPLIPRMMSEDAHSRTGIDIHPGAKIGRAFFIDHGTGVVIGETCVIGDRVKIYQGVTLGALSFPLDENGNPVKGIKRHPDAEDDVTIYGGATILGDVTIGKGSVIGGNVWLTHSVPPYSKVYNRQPTPLVKQANGRWRTAEGEWNDPGAGI
ncbi:MAG: serine O-acetyltransferase EpsC [Kiritimatiellia bacterium]